MARLATNRWMFPMATAAVITGVLSFYGSSIAQQRGPTQPFANSVQQRMDMVQHLKAIEDLLREQNDLLRSGKLKVVVEQTTGK